MRVLTLATYLSIDEYREFSRSKTGLGYITYKIVDFISNNNVDMYVLTQSAITDEKIIGKIHIVRRKWPDILKNIKPQYIIQGLKTLKDTGCKGLSKLNNIFYFCASGYVEAVIRQLKPDVVHIHTITYYSLGYLMACVRTNVPFLVTLHGLSSLNPSIFDSEKRKKLEKDFLKLAQEKNIPVTVISTGVKKRIEQQIVGKPCHNISVITNGTAIDISHITSNIRQKHSISPHKKILLCVGNVSINKNQYQVLDAYTHFSDEIKKDFVLLFIGRDNPNNPISGIIHKYGLDKDVIFIGAVPNKEMDQYYKEAYGNILASISEGFGLSIIESFAYGVPSVCFSDIDATEDIYDDRVMITVDERSDQALANAIEKLCYKDWDREYIINHAQKFSLDAMAENYIKYYSKVGKTGVSIKDIKRLLI